MVNVFSMCLDLCALIDVFAINFFKPYIYNTCYFPHTETCLVLQYLC